jgi:hypothetical protein
LTSGINCLIAYGVPSPKFTTFRLRGVWTGIAKALRIVDGDATEEVLRLILVKAIGAVPNVCDSASNYLRLEVF